MEKTIDNDGIHYGTSVINFFGYWCAGLFSIIIIWVLALTTFQMIHPPEDAASNYLSEMVQLVGYVVSAFVGSITTLLAVFAGNKAKDMMAATSQQRAADQKTVESNRKSVSSTHMAEVVAYDKLEESANIDIELT
jgi:uncharacterized membrane protein